MSLPAGLFIEAPHTEDVSLHALSEDTNVWTEEITQKVMERLPQIKGLNIMIKFMKMDEENGTATGSVSVSSNDKQAVIPLIIKDFMMYPLDIFIFEKKLLPLTVESFDKAFNNNEVFGDLEEYPLFGGLGRFEDANLWNTMYPPSLGRYAYASAGYPVLDEISDTISGKDFKEYLLKNPEVAANFHKQGHVEVIKKLANLQPVNMNEFRQGSENLIRKNIVMLRRDGVNKYTILANSDKVFSPAITKVTRPELGEFVSKISDCVHDTMNEVDQNGEKVLLIEDPTPNHILVEGRSPVDRVEMATEFDHYAVLNKNGVTHVGVVIPTVIDFDQNKKNLKIFIGKTMATIQEEIAGVRLQNNSFRMEESSPKIGQTGTFVYQSNKSKALATIPVTIESVSQYECALPKIKAMDLLGNGYELTFGDHLERIAGMGEGKYILPTKFKWIPMEGFEQITNSPASYHTKTAGSKEANPITLIPTGFGQYAVKGVNKYAQALDWDATNLDKSQATFLLVSLGIGQEKLAEAYKMAGIKGQAVIRGAHFIPLKSEKIAQALPKARELLKFAEGLRSNLIKEASFVNNSQTVDALLSLNFVNPENVAKFVGKIPAFKAAISNLASCLIASRLGIQEIPEQATATAMQRLLEVVKGLETLRATQQEQAPA